MICENIRIGEGTGYPLEGILTLPEGIGFPVPAVVLVHGSGPTNRDEKVGKLTPFKDLAEGLAQRGIASLRYDKRTFVYKKELAGQVLTVREEVNEDVLRALNLMRKDSRIDPDRVFILGHSMGGMLAPRIDAEGADAAGLILMAGSPCRLEDIVLRQFTQAGKQKSFLGWITRLEYRFFSRKFRGLYEMPEEEAKKKKFAGNISLYYFQEMGRRTAVDYLKDSDKPVLILQGGRDFQALADTDFRGFEEQLAGRAHTSYKLYPDLNHCFVPALTDDILKSSLEYGTERHIGEEVLGDIASFIRNPG
ncbi:MAG: alpha/beta fold hydrolase, partial [Clostridia bacterium]|nr:alpha/beta fold hydrolase [Clostridia bacterium]